MAHIPLCEVKMGKKMRKFIEFVEEKKSIWNNLFSWSFGSVDLVADLSPMPRSSRLTATKTTTNWFVLCCATCNRTPQLKPNHIKWNAYMNCSRCNSKCQRLNIQLHRKRCMGKMESFFLNGKFNYQKANQVRLLTLASSIHSSDFSRRTPWLLRHNFLSACIARTYAFSSSFHLKLCLFSFLLSFSLSSLSFWFVFRKLCCTTVHATLYCAGIYIWNIFMFY